MSLIEFQQTVDEMVRDQNKVIEPESRDRAINTAMRRYDQDAPALYKDDLLWQQTGVFCPLPAYWNTLHKLKSSAWVEQSGALQPLFSEAIYYQDQWQLESLKAIPADDRVRIEYTRPYEFAEVPAPHHEAICAYAAHLLCRQLAAHFSGERDATIGADHSRTESRARNYAARAKEYRVTYFSVLGLADPDIEGVKTKPAVGVATWPARNPRHKLVKRLGGT